jgi:hypothetical protein
MPQSTLAPLTQDTHEKMKSWFEQMIQKLAVDKMRLETGTASPEMEARYEQLIFGSQAEISQSARVMSSMYFIEALVSDYLHDLVQRKARPQKLALEPSDAKVLVWAEIDEDDEKTEDALLLAEATVNAKYDKYGFHISSTIVESSDKLAVPNHYLTVISRANV